MSAPPDLVALLATVEKEYADRGGVHYQAWREGVLHALEPMLAVLRKAHAAGWRSRMLREATLERLRVFQADGQWGRLWGDDVCDLVCADVGIGPNSETPGRPGYRFVWISDEAVAALRDLHRGGEASEGQMARVLRLILRTVAPVLAEPTAPPVDAAIPPMADSPPPTDEGWPQAIKAAREAVLLWRSNPMGSHVGPVHIAVLLAALDAHAAGPALLARLAEAERKAAVEYEHAQRSLEHIAKLEVAVTQRDPCGWQGAAEVVALKLDEARQELAKKAARVVELEGQLADEQAISEARRGIGEAAMERLATLETVEPALRSRVAELESTVARVAILIEQWLNREDYLVRGAHEWVARCTELRAVLAGPVKP